MIHDKDEIVNVHYCTVCMKGYDPCIEQWEYIEEIKTWYKEGEAKFIPDVLSPRCITLYMKNHTFLSKNDNASLVAKLVGNMTFALNNGLDGNRCDGKKANSIQMKGGINK
jgi:hypothetical protein